MKQNVDVVRIRENSIQLNGWVIGKTPESVPELRTLDSIFSFPMSGERIITW